MNKSELIDAMADAADISKAAAGRALEGMIEGITGALKSGKTVSIVGFGTFVVRDRAARTGRNPKTGEEIPITPRRVVTFRPGQKLKAKVEGYAGRE